MYAADNFEMPNFLKGHNSGKNKECGQNLIR